MNHRPAQSQDDQTSKTVRAYQQRFRATLHGTWQTSKGTAEALYSDSITFNRDGTGEQVRRSLMSGETAVQFKWREAGALTVEISEIFEDEPDEWETIKYNFKIAANDYGTIEPVLYQVGQNGFWIVADPMRFVDESGSVEKLDG